jgi:cellulose synthase (UDP-forming)
MTHFLYALPRLIFLTAPLIYLIFGHVNIPGYWAAILAYAFPHLALSNIANSRIQGQHRHSFWNDIYETVLAPYILLPTILALINPKLGRFHVTAKGGVVNRRFFDRHLARPFLFMIGLNLLGILCAIPRLFRFPGATSAFPLNLFARMYDGNHVGTIVVNLIWVCFNLIILGVATSVAWESRQRRQTVRLAMTVPADVQLPNGSIIHGVTTDVSSGGLMIRMERDFIASPGDAIKLTLPVLDGNATLPATLVGISGNTLRAQFDPLTLQEEEALTMVLYSRADTWLGWGETREPDKPLVSLGRIIKLSFFGLTKALREATKSKDAPPSRKLATSIVPLCILAVLLGAALKPNPAIAQTSISANTAPFAPVPFDSTLALSDLGVSNTIVLHGVDALDTIHFSLPRTQLVKTATVHLRYHVSPGLIPSLSHLKVSLNGTLFATLPVTMQSAAVMAPNSAQTANSPHSENNSLLESAITLPAELLAPDNELTFEFIGHYDTKCEDPSHSTLWAHIDNNSTIEFAGTLIPLEDNLKLLPAPFYDSKINLRPAIPIAFLTQPSPKALQAAGIVASWFGVLADSRPIRFPVSIGAIPPGNAIIIGESAAALPVSLEMTTISGPSIAIRSNPSDPYSKVLVLTGDSPDDVLTAAMALTLQRDLLQGAMVRVPSIKLAAPRDPDDAPRWLSTDKINRIGDIEQTNTFDTDGNSPVAVYMRLPPDLYYAYRAQQNLAFHLSYRYNSIPLANGSTLQVSVNDAYASSTPLPHSDKASTQLDAIVPVPISNLRPFSNSFLMRFLLALPKKDECEDAAANNLSGAILKDSYLDLQGIPHWATLPNLEIFANAGYPFTRRADLADTAIVLPDTPAAEEIEMYLTLMGHFGAQTGYPVLNVSVTNAEGMKSGTGKDYLVIGTVDDQAAISRLNPSLPVGIDGSGLHIQDTQGFFAQLQHAWWKVRSSDRVQSGQLETAGLLPDALIEGIEWPSGSSHSVVVIALRDKTVVPNFLSVFLKTSQSSDVSQSVSVLHGSRFTSYRIGNDVYHVGTLSPWIKLNMFFEHYQWLMVACILFFCFLIAMILRSILRKKARSRLQGNS